MKIDNSKRRLLINASLLVASFMVFGILGEFALRVSGYKGAPESIISNVRLVDDKILNWRYAPNSIVHSGNVSYQYNEEGFRDIRHVYNSTRHIRRIVIVGDSVSEGAGVPWESVFAPQLQARLGDEYEVINWSMSGLNTPQEVHLLEKPGLAYRPDIVILNFVLNDADFYTEYFAAKRFVEQKDSAIGLLGVSVSPKVKQLLKSSAFIYFIKQRMENLIGRITGRSEVNYYSALWGKDENRHKVMDGFAKIADLSKTHGFRPFIVIWPLLTDYGTYQFLYVHEWVAEQAHKNGLEVIDLLKSFTQMPFRSLQVTAEDNVHPNAIGHRIAAEVVYNAMVARPSMTTGVKQSSYSP